MDFFRARMFAQAANPCFTTSRPIIVASSSEAVVTRTTMNCDCLDSERRPTFGSIHHPSLYCPIDTCENKALSYFDFKYGGMMGYTISVQELKQRLDFGSKPFLLDVREPYEYSMAKLEGSVLIPLGTLPQCLDKLDQNAEIV